jgi:tRNA(Ile2) C34 agmatinyltransferase TiaS
MWPFSQPKCPACGGTLVPNSGTIGHAAYKCPACIKRNTKADTDKEASGG